jgi:hypothetical protein
MIDYTKILVRKYQGTSWTLNGESYDGLTWLDDSDKPTQEELDALWPVVEAEIEAEAQAKEEARESVLGKLGVTAEELAVLLS